MFSRIRVNSYRNEGVNMKSKNRKRLLCAVIFCLMMCVGCQEAPKEVQERMERYGVNEQMSGTEIKHCSVEELKQTNVSEETAGLDNMTISQTTDFSNIESLAILDMAYEDTFADNLDDFVKLFDIDKSTIQVNDHGTGRTDLHESDDPVARTYFAMENNGFVSYISGLTYSYIKDEIQKVDTTETYDAAVDDLSGKSVAFEDGEVPIVDMMDTAEKRMEKDMPIDGCSYRVSEVYVRELKEGKKSAKQLSMGMNILYKGVRLNPYIMKFEELGNDAGENENRHVEVSYTGAETDYEGKDKLTYLANFNGKLKINSAEPVSEVVSLSSAVQLVNEKIAGFTELKIDRLLPMYALLPQYPDKKTVCGTPGQKIVGRPVYAFLINLDSQGISDFGINRTAELFICVDMVTGEIITNIEDPDEEE